MIVILEKCSDQNFWGVKEIVNLAQHQNVDKGTESGKLKEKSMSGLTAGWMEERKWKAEGVGSVKDPW